MYWADAALGANAADADSSAARKAQRIERMVGSLTIGAASAADVLECKRPCSAARRMSDAGRSWPLRGLLAGESSAAGFFSIRSRFRRQRCDGFCVYVIGGYSFFSGGSDGACGWVTPSN